MTLLDELRVGNNILVNGLEYIVTNVVDNQGERAFSVKRSTENVNEDLTEKRIGKDKDFVEAIEIEFEDNNQWLHKLGFKRNTTDKNEIWSC